MQVDGRFGANPEDRVFAPVAFVVEHATCTPPACTDEDDHCTEAEAGFDEGLPSFCLPHSRLYENPYERKK